jgi:hypothetical protein
VIFGWYLKYAKVQSYAILNQYILVLALWRHSCKLKAKAISHLPSLLAVIDAIYLTFSESRYVASSCHCISGFQDSLFPVIDSVWKSEIFVGAGNFTFMADILSTQLIESRARKEMVGISVKQLVG